MERRSSISGHESQKFWGRYLAGAEPCHFPKFDAENDNAATPLHLTLDPRATEGLLVHFAQDAELLASALQVTWALLLPLYTGTNDVSFRYVETRRRHSASEPIQLQSLARVQFSKDDTLGNLLQSVRADYAKRSDYQRDLPRISNNTVLASFAELTNSELVYEPPGNNRELETKYSNLSAVHKGHIRLHAKCFDDRISIFLEWWSSEMSMQQARSVAATFVQILRSVILSPDLQRQHMSCFSDHDLHQTAAWNSASLQKVETTIHDTISKNARDRPGTAAIDAWDRTFSYGELDRVSSRIAERLRSYGVSTEISVALCFQKSAYNVIAMLAVMKAGGTFVPLDPTHPPSRLASLARRVNAQLLLCSSELVDTLESVVRTVVPIDKSSWEESATHDTGSVQAVPIDAAAYIIFTSGTTGEPKATVIEHAAFVSSARAHGPALLVEQTTRALHFAAHTFDASLVEILTVLIVGGCICIPDEHERLNDLPAAMNRMRVNWACLTPSFVNFLQPSDIPTLKSLVLAGEAMSTSHIETWSSIRLVNGYGPSEASICSVANSDVRADTEPSNIGYPVGVHCWVVAPEDHDRLVPLGCVGELLLEGPTLSRGYMGMPDRTEAAFIVNPVWSRHSNAGRRFYKTGDLVRWNVRDGTLTFCGRKDNQIKIHGQRVELAEIEHHVTKGDGIDHALVLFPKRGLCQRRLVAVVSMDNGSAADIATSSSNELTLLAGQRKEAADITITGLRDHLRTALPSYMVPSLWAIVETLPMLTSGKLDRKRVLNWTESIPEEVWNQLTAVEQSSSGEIRTLTPIENDIRTVWSHVLNINAEKIDLQRSFLSLGGDSITALQVVSQFQKKSLAVTVQEVLRATSIASLAGKVQIAAPARQHTEEVETEFGLSPIQQMFFALPNQGQGHFNQSFFLKFSREITFNALSSAVHKLVQRHSMLRSRFAQNEFGGGWQQRVTDDIADSIRVRSHQVKSRSEAIPLIQSAQECTNPETGPMFVVEYFDLASSREQLVFLTGHHLVIDLVSWRVLLEELEDLLEGRQQSLAPPTLPFQSWCQLQLQHCKTLTPEMVLPQADIPVGNMAYWNMVAQPNTYGAVAVEGFELDTIETQLFTNCHAALKTDAMDLLTTSLIHSFSRTFADREVPAMYVEGHGREPWDVNIDLSRTVGWFTTLHPIHVDSSGDALNTLRRVKDFRRKVLDKGRPYFSSRVLNPKCRRAFSKHWPFEVTFNYLGQYQQLEREGALLMPAAEMSGEARSAGNGADYGDATPRFGLFEISAVISKGQLRFSFTFNKHMKFQDQIRFWIESCRDTLVEISQTLSVMRAEPTLMDFPKVKLSYEDLRVFVNETLPTLGIHDVDQIQDLYPCSNIQEGLLLSRSKDSAFYAVQVVYEATSTGLGAPDAERLCSAWKSVVSRHPLLRTLFVENIGYGSEVYDQVVLNSIKPNILRLTSENEQACLRLLNQRDWQAYEDSKQPPHRFTVCELPNGRIFWRLEIAHTIMDGASMTIIARDLAAFYDGQNLPTVPQYSDYVNHVNAEVTEEGVSFWKRYLKGIEPSHFPVLNDGIPAAKRLESLRIDFARLPQLQKSCEVAGITLSNAMHAAWALTLSNYTGQNDTSFGYLVSGRDAPVANVEAGVGPFINSLVCRVLIDPEQPLAKVLNDVQSDYLDSLPHRFHSLAQVQHSLGLAETTLFNTALSYRRVPNLRDAKQSIDFVEALPIYDPTEYNVSLNVEVYDDNATIDLDFWTHLLSTGQAQYVASLFVQSLENIISQSAVKVKDLDNFSAACHSSVFSWNATLWPASNQCMHTAFSEQVKQRPNAEAIHGWDANFTYAKLDALSNSLAHYLVDLGVKPDTLIPICFEKSAWTTVAMLAILKAGGGFVPLDSTHPKSALEIRVQDARARIVLASTSCAGMFTDLVPNVVAVTEQFVTGLRTSNKTPTTAVSPANIAVVIYTSGSTGRPKGVVLTHDGLTTSAAAHGPAMNIGPHTRALQFAAYTFDNSLEETFTTLMRGGCVCVPTDHDRLNDLAGVINRYKVNWTDLTPTVAGFLKPEDVPNLENLGLGGEAVTKTVLELWKDSKAQLHCVYGPSECSINSSWNGQVGKVGEVTNIGRGVGCVLWIVDANNHHKLAPVGCAGELLVEGPIVGRGYLNDPEKTAAAFIMDPAWTQGAGLGPRRMYKTGDLCRYNSDGSITYLGRKDTQVKLNGQRLELAEIEHHVQSALPESAQSAVELVITSGRKQLAAFLYLLAGDAVPAANEDDFILPMTPDFKKQGHSLQQHLASLLPAYMVPTMFVPVSRMPLTSSGKLDRKRLRGLPTALSDQQVSSYRLAGSSGRAPSTEMEKTLCALWQEVLRLGSTAIGVEDSFFRLGGDSIYAMKLVNAARAQQITLPITIIFSKPKLIDMAQEADLGSKNTATEDEELDVPPFSLLSSAVDLDELIAEITTECGVSTDDVENIYPCSQLQEGLVALSTKQAGAYVAQNVYKLGTDIDLTRFKDAWNTVIQGEVVLRTRIVYTKRHGFMQVVLRQLPGWYTGADLSEITAEDRHLPSHNGGELSRYAIVGDESEEMYFVWTIHHSLYDGWCISTILQRVEDAYRNSTVPDPASTSIYPRFIKYLEAMDAEAAKSFWIARLDNSHAPQFPALPYPNHQTQAKHHASASTPFTKVANSEVTIASMVRAAWAVAVSIYSASDDVVFGETLTGRDAHVQGIEECFGPTLATVPSRVTIDREVTVVEYLQKVQSQSVEAIGYQHTGLQNIRRFSEDTASACQFQNLIAINQGVDEESDFWALQGNPTSGAFYTYALMLQCNIGEDRITVEADYDQQVLPTWLVTRLLSQFTFLIDTFNTLDNASRKIGDLAILSAADEKILLSWNKDSREPVRECLHDMIARRSAAQSPDKVAITGWDGHMTYHEMEKAANRLASHLHGLGADRLTVIPILFDKSVWGVVAILAILKTGAAWTPMDPSHPPARLRSIISDTSAKIIVCSPSHTDLAQTLVDKVVQYSGKNAASIQAGTSRLPSSSPDDPAYLLFTSGTTGTPKGTVIQHAAIATCALAQARSMHIKADTRTLQFASYTFDASITEIIVTLISGGTVCVPSESERLNSIADFIDKHEANWTLLTPTFIQTIQPSRVPTLRTIVLGGEAASQQHVTTWMDKVKLLNAYGPTEASVVATCNEFSLSNLTANNIGKAVVGRTWVVDGQNVNRLAPIGSIGELLLEGPALAQGYLNNPEKTAEAFIEDPAWSIDQQLNSGRHTVRRFYCTGDLVRYDEHGNIQYIGRKDNQAKLRGQRMELGEVEHHLKTDALVKHALVTIPSEGPCKNRLVAVLSLQESTGATAQAGPFELVTREGAAFNISAIRDRLTGRLPGYMVPTKWVVLTQLPLLASSKLDQRSILRWLYSMSDDLYRQISEIETTIAIKQQPTTATESVLQKIIGDVLNLAPHEVDLSLSFVSLGGDSISAISVMSRCRAENLGLNVQDIIKSKSIVQLASRSTSTQAVTYTAEPVGQLFDLSPIQKLYFSMVGDEWQHFNQSVLLRLNQPISKATVQKAIETIVGHHAMLRARFRKDETQSWKQYITADVNTSYSFNNHVLPEGNEKLMVDVVEKSQRSLNVEQGPVLAVDLFESTDKDVLVSIAAHHLVIDVVSWRIFIQNFEDILASGSLKTEGSLPFQTWSRLQQEQAQALAISSALPSDDVPVSDFAFWGMEGAKNIHGDTISESFQLDTVTSLALLGKCNQTLSSEPVDVFLAALLQSFQVSFTDRDGAPAIYNEGHGREPWESHLDLSQTIGWFTTMAPIFLPRENDGEIVDCIQWIKDLRQRTPGKGRPYFAQRWLTAEGQQKFVAHSPMEITFNYLGQMQQLERNDTIVQPVMGGSGMPETSSTDVGAATPRFSLFEVSATVSHGSIGFTFSFNKNMHKQEGIAKWVQECKNTLETAAKRLSQMDPQKTLTDFPLLPLAYKGIDEIKHYLPKVGVESLEEVEDVFPTSSMQHGILLSQLKNPEHYAFSCIFEVQPSGNATVDPRRLAEAWQTVVQRHSALRTVFVDSTLKKGGMDQVVLRHATARTAWLQSESANAMEVLSEQKIINCREVQPPHRFTLCLAPGGKVFCKLEMSHAISDGTSMPLMIRDLAQAYSGISWATPAPLYSDFIAHLQSGAHEADINYWKTYLADIENCHFPALNESKATNVIHSFDGKISNAQELQAFCTKHGFTLSNLLQFVWALVLRCYCASNTICFGYVASGRDVPVEGIHEAVGAFINMLICKLSLPDDLTIEAALQHIQSDFVGSMAHQTCSLAEVQHELKLSGVSLFNTAFTFQKRSGQAQLSQSDVDFKVLAAEDPSEYSLTLNAEATEESINISLTYWLHNLSAAQAENVFHTFAHLLSQVTRFENQDKKIGELDFFNEHDREVVKGWNGVLPGKVDKCVHDIISHQAVVRPKSTPALAAWNGEFTFTELDKITNKLAAHLVSLGVGPEIFVPLCFEKSAFYVISLISVMKAGGAFVPLDPAHPASRIKNLVENVKGHLILCSEQYHAKASEAAQTALTIDSAFLHSLPDRPAPANTGVGPNNPAYIIFTSGTTGMPKGTVIEHAAFCTAAIAHSRAMNMTSASRVLQFASHTFDASIMEIMSTLVVGGCVCIPSDQERMNDLPAAMEKLGVSWTLLTPSVANTIKPDSLPSLRVLVTGGEAMSAGHIERWSASKVSLVNAYGPSETSVIATISIKVDLEGNMLDSNPSNIGHACGGRCWIVDPNDHHKLVPIGCVGELVVEGRIVAREYLNNTAKTAAAFISNPAWMKGHGFGGELGQGSDRMYRTGDLVRYNADGSFNFVARKDTQIKLNGQRIELGEIEYHVRNNLPEGSQAAVELVTPAGKTAAKALAAFFCFKSDQSGSASQESKAALSMADGSTADEILLPISGQAQVIAKALETALGTAIPSYMIPSIYVPLTKIPWTTAGKLDRQRLRNIVQALPKDMLAPYRLAASAVKKAPTTEMEKKLQVLWESVLAMGKGTVGVEDNFFRVGGDSLAAMRLVSAAALEKIAITVINIFRKPKLSEMAKVCTVVEDEVDGELRPFSLLKGDDEVSEVIEELSSQIRVDKSSIMDAYPCSSLQEGLFTLSIKQPGAYVANNVFRLPKTIDLPRFKAAFEKTVEEVDVLRTRLVHMRSSAFVQAVLRSDKIDWQHSTELSSISEEAPKIPAHNGGLLTRYTIVDDEASGEKFLVWAIHHALYDGWSFPIVLKRIEQMYFEGETKLAKTPFSSFIKYITQNDIQVSEDFWKTKLAGAAPLAFPQPLASANAEGNNTQTLVHDAKLNKPFAGMGITMPTLIRAAWSIIVAAYSGSEDVVFGETMTGRDVPVQGIQDVLGPTLTTVPTRIQIKRTTPIMNFLEEIGRMNTDTIPHQHLGLQHIRRLDSDTALACDFQNLLVIQMAQEDDGKSGKSFWDVANNGVGGNFFTYPLVIEARAAAMSVEVEAHHNARVLPEWQVQRLLYQFEGVLQQLNSALHEKTGKLSDIMTVSTQDIQQMQEWNSALPETVNECIHSLIIEKADEQPDKQAICAWDGDLTYGELREYSSRLAHRLTKLGVGSEVKVPICLNKSRWAVVAIVAILMAGGAYVPLDPKHPESRHSEISSDVGAKIILCTPEYKERCSKLAPNAIPIDQESIESLTAVPNLLALNNRCTPDNAAYVIYTSGSTGKPKGTVVDHKSFTSSSAGFSEAQLLTGDARAFQFASFTFDVSCMEMFSTLILGGTVCVPSEEQRLKNPGEAIAALKVSWSFLTPSVANIIEPDNVPTLKILVCGGEAMSIENVIRWENHVKLVNGYGPTEASVISVVNNKVSEKKNPGTIGFATCGFAWITDPTDHNTLAPIGCVGEMLLEGPLLAREYLNDIEKTNAAFVSNLRWMSTFTLPNTQAQTRRLYKTGDLVRYNQDGSLAYIGRKDNQVKLNGQRLELGEIEHRMDTNPKIRHSLVVLPKKGPCKKRLVGVLSLAELDASRDAANKCILVDGEQNLNVARTQLGQIQTTLSGQLPPYMVPTVWAVVENLPLLPSGKLDRRNVAAWVDSMDDETYDKICGVDASGSSGTPTTVIGKVLQDIIARVLNIPVKRVNLNQSFLALGGDSISAMQVMARCSKERVTLSLNDILRSKSISQMGLCASIGVAVKGQEEKLDYLFDLSPIQQLYLECKPGFVGEARFNQSFTLRIAKKVEVQVIGNAIETIVAQHSMLRARFHKGNNGWQQKITADTKTSYRFNSHTVSAPKDLIPIVGKSQSGLDIENGPLFSADLFGIENVGQVIVLVGHHLIVDMVSWRVILGDLEELIESGSLTMDKPLSFQAWGNMQAQHAAQNAAKSSKKILPFKVTPADMSYWGMLDKPNTYDSTTSEMFTVSEAVTAKALGKANEAIRTEPIELFLSVLAHSFSRVFKDRATPTFWNEGHGREPWDSAIDLSRTVGWFTTIAPAHVDVAKGADDVVDTIRRMKDNRRQIPANGRPYFAHRYLTAEGRWQFGDHMPMEIVFNYLGKMQQLESDDALLQSFEYTDSDEETRIIADVGPKAPRFALFEISAVVVQDKLQFSYIYNSEMGKQAEIKAWMSECKRTLESAVNELVTMRSVPTLSDYPVLPITYDEMHELVDTTFPAQGINHPDEVEDVYPCAPMQEGLFLSQLRDPASYMFNCVYEVEPVTPGVKIDGKKLFNVWQQVVDRHPALRSLFVDSVCKGGVFDQIVMKKVDSGVLYIECDDDVALERLAEVKLTETNYKKKPRLPHQGTVLVTTTGKVLFKLEVNHAVIDGGSAALIIEDFIAAYEDRLPQGSGPLYSSYISYIRSQPPSSDVSFWKNYLEDLRPCYFPQLVTEAPKVKELGAVELDFGLPRYKELQDLCVRTQVTFSNIMEVAWALVLRKYTKSDDVCFGYLTAGRDAPVEKIGESIGAFINMLVCRIRFTRTHTLHQVFEKVQNDYLESIPYQHCSLAQMQHELGLEGKALFNTAMSIQNHSKAADFTKGSITMEPCAAHDPSEYSVTVNVEAMRGDEGVVFRYWTNVVSHEQAQTLADDMIHVLSSILENSQQTLIEFDGVKDIPQVEVAPQVPVAAVNPMAGFDMEASLRKIVTECVKDVVTELIASGALQGASANNVNKMVRKKANRRLAAAANHDAAIEDSEDEDQPHSGDEDEDQDREISLPKKVTPVKPKSKRRASIADTPATRRAAKSAVRQKLMEIWATLLDMDEKDITNEDSFFGLGGDSIIAMKMVGVAREAGLAMTVADVFKHPVFGDMCDALSTAGEKRTRRGSIAIDPEQAKREAAIQIPYKPYALLKADDVETFLRVVISPSARVFRGGIVDVLPVTDFQALAVTGALLQSKWMLNYFFLDGNGPIDVVKLRTSAFKLVQAYDILRTVFVPHQDQFLQVVLRKLQPEFVVEDTDEELEVYAKNLQQRDFKKGLRMGDSYVKFVVVRQRGSQRHRIFIRMSHAQYDGVCFARILLALQASYKGQALVEPPSFANYVWSSAGNVTKSHYEHWAHLLKDSQMTHIVQREGPNYNQSADEGSQILRQTVKVRSLASQNITMATIVKAAWALALATTSARDDVVFGHVISGRNDALEGIENIVGPCLNMVPVRIRFQPGWTAIDLLRVIQEQQVANMPFEGLGFREITKHCTEWPDWTYFSTIVQHQNIDRGQKLSIGDNAYEVGALSTAGDFADLSLLSTPLNADELELSLSVSSAVTSSSPNFAKSIMRMLGEIIQQISASPHLSLPEPDHFATLAPQTIVEKIDLEKRPTKTAPSQTEHFQGTSKDELLILSDSLTRAWREVLSDKSGRPLPLRLDSSFFELGGDIMGMAQVASLLEHDGYSVRVDDLIEYPVMLEQLALLSLCSSKRKRKEEQRLLEKTKREEREAQNAKLKNAKISRARTVFSDFSGGSRNGSRRNSFDKGSKGANGLNGSNGANGANGSNGVNGANGHNGHNGYNGTNGSLNGANGNNTAEDTSAGDELTPKKKKGWLGKLMKGSA